jgi:uncharacterized coiled-coil DUF342 family protein
MRHTCRLSAWLVVILALVPWVAAQRHRDPLTQPEIGQLRDTALEPDKRLKLYIEFARKRLATVEDVRGDTKIADKGQETHDRLQDFLDVYDELDDNVDTYADRREDLRKPLKDLIEAETEFQARLRAIRESAAATPAELQQYQFLLANAIDAVDSGVKDHRDLLAEQEEAAKHKKKK